MTTDNDDDELPAGTITHLGFCVPLDDDTRSLGHTSPFWETWDGGQVGGIPSWLQPHDIPRQPLRCTSCSKLLRFVCQLYAPADQVNANAFHRSLYVFCCSHGCLKNNNNNQQHSSSAGICVLRAQLPEKNPFYPNDGTKSSSSCEVWNQHESSTWKVHLCVVCGQRAKGQCPIQREYFCSKEHQLEYKKYRGLKENEGNEAGNDKDSKEEEKDVDYKQDEDLKEVEEKTEEEKDNEQHGKNDRKKLNNNKRVVSPSVFPKWELVVEDEPPSEDCGDDNDNAASSKQPLFPSKLSKKKESLSTLDSEDDDDDSDADLEQDDLNMMTGAAAASNNKTKTDPTTTAFHERIQRPGARNQCIRYRQWPNHDTNGANNNEKNGNDGDLEDDPGAPLWIRSDFRPSEPPPDCSYCGAPRKFEFQIMPQMLHYLQQKIPQSNVTATANPSKSATPSNSNDLKQSTAQAKEILEQANALADQVPPESLPANFEEQRQAAIASVQQQLFKSNPNEMDWGTIVVYTCTASCDKKGLENMETEHDQDLGAYMEEYAWWQPPLDDL